MATRILALALCALLFGCGANPPRQPGFVANFYGGTLKGSLLCQNAAQCIVWIIPGCSPSNPADCGGQLEYDPVELAHDHGNLKVTWNLPQYYKFCPLLGDGVFLKDELTDQFRLEPRPPGQDCTDSIQLTAVNSASRAAPYKYKLLFHDTRDLGKQYVVDPSFVNR